jgi:hypothetical protein
MTQKGKEITFNSVLEFEKEIFPKAYKKRTMENETDAKSLGISLAKESLDKIKKKLID